MESIALMIMRCQLDVGRKVKQVGRNAWLSHTEKGLLLKTSLSGRVPPELKKNERIKKASIFVISIVIMSASGSKTEICAGGVAFARSNAKINYIEYTPAATTLVNISNFNSSRQTRNEPTRPGTQALICLIMKS